MKQIHELSGKILYGIAFLILIPVGLWFWAQATQNAVPFPKIESKPVGALWIIVGGLLLLSAMYALKKTGRGLPMNAYPPPLLVTNGPYRYFRHPIYMGFGILMIGVFLFSGSSSGLWLVSPLTILGMIALVLGYEEVDLKQRFPNQTINTVLDLPEKSAKQPDLRDRFASCFWIVTCLIFGNFIISELSGAAAPAFGEPLGIFPGLRNADLPFLSFIFVLLVPFFLRRKDLLREWAISGIVALSCLIFTGLLYPEFGAQYFSPFNSSLIAIPIVLIFITLSAIFRQLPQTFILFVIPSLILFMIQLTNDRSALIDLAESILVFLLSANYRRIWIFLKDSSAKIANSWKEWTFGKVRVINHGFYVGFGAFFGVLLASILAGKNYGIALLVFTLLVTISSALWAQIIEGSEKLKRPFGFYGGLVGILFGSLVVWAIGLDYWVIIGVGSVVMPWVQAIGRFRCLVNGCCHGRRTENEEIGIRYFHPRSRVCNISGLKGELVHPTQLYSILWLFLVGILMLTLWNRNVPVTLIFGLYLILTNLGRFVEEAYRGEVQTPGIKGLHLYQWTAIVAVIVGILMTMIHIAPPVIHPGLDWESVFVALISGLFIFFAMGVDFPHSNRRFSRLV